MTKDPNDPARVTGVRGWDLLAGRQRTFAADQVVLCAGTIESAKIALQSQLADPNGKIGRGITDHTIRYRHFTLPPGAAHYADLNEGNQVAVTGVPADPVTVTVAPTPPPSAADLAEADQLAAGLFAAMGAQPVLGEGGLGLQTAGLGGVAHEVGTLRMAADGSGVVDENLTFVAYDNLWACDNSVFPTSPAANPSLTLAALALRLAAHLP